MTRQEAATEYKVIRNSAAVRYGISTEAFDGVVAEMVGKRKDDFGQWCAAAAAYHMELGEG